MKKPRMKVRKIDDGYYEVAQGDKWWTVQYLGFSRHLIVNRRGQVVPSTGPTGRRIVTAVLGWDGNS